MRITIVVDDELLEDLMLLGGSKKGINAVINEVIKDYVSRQKMQGILELKGKMKFEDGHLVGLREAEEKEGNAFVS